MINIMKKRNKKGFTLVELVVVIAILGLLAAIAVPRLGKFKEDARLKANNATAAVIGRAAEIYIASQDTVPATIDLDDLEAYLDAETLALEDVTISVDADKGDVTVNGPGEGNYPIEDEAAPVTNSGE